MIPCEWPSMCCLLPNRSRRIWTKSEGNHQVLRFSLSSCCEVRITLRWGEKSSEKKHYASGKNCSFSSRHLFINGKKLIVIMWWGETQTSKYCKGVSEEMTSTLSTQTYIVTVGSVASCKFKERQEIPSEKFVHHRRKRNFIPFLAEKRWNAANFLENVKIA